MTATGTFVLADIGGYTSFLSGVGITHAREITEHLLNRLIRTNRKHWRVGNIMGDCVFFYTQSPEPPNQTFANVCTLYHEFQDAKADVVSGSTCRCGACDRTHELSLKFVVHEGEYDTQNIGGRKELIGHDIVLATRLLKNSVPVEEYVLATPAASAVAEAADLPAAAATDDLEAIGPFEYSYIDLTPIREAHARSREVYLGATDSILTVSEEIEAPSDRVWDAMMDLTKRSIWQTTIKEMTHIEGEEGQVGEVHQCLHTGGTQIVHLTVAIDQSNRRRTERVWITPALLKDIHMTMQAEALDEGRTRAHLFATAKPRYPVVSHLAWPVFLWMLKRDVKKDIAGLKEFCETGRVAAREAQSSAA
jgi:hypothetical protein